MVITLTGLNSFGLQTELHTIIDTFVRDHGDMGLERLDGEEATAEQMRAAAESLPFLTARKLVVLREPSKQKKFTEGIDAFLAAISDATDVILVEPKLDKRLSYYKVLKKKTDFREFSELDVNGLARWVSDYAKQQGASIRSSDARFLVDRVGLRQQLLVGELDKLMLHSPEITRETIELLTEATPQSTIFELLEAAFAGNHRHMLRLYAEQRTLKVEPQQIIAMLAWQLHIVALVKTAEGRTPEVIAKEAKLNPYVVKKSVAIAHRLTLPQLKSFIHDLTQLDIRLKRQAIDADEALQYFLLGLSQ
jgi:DNA polymerase III subunit delta